MDPSSLAQLLSGVFSGAAGISQLGQAGTNAAAGASAADPFASQRPQYQAALSGQVGQINGQQASGTGTINSLLQNLLSANTQVTGDPGALATAQNLTAAQNGQIAGIGGLNSNAGTTTASENNAGANLTSQLSQLAGNYMSNPAIQAQYQLGLASATRGAAASGTAVSGGQLAQLEQYGQQFASGAYQQTFNDLVTGASTSNNMNLQATQEQAALSGQTFNQGLAQQQGMAGLLQQQEQNEMGFNQSAAANQQASAGNFINQIGTGLSAVNQSNATNLQSSQGVLNSLLTASGASTGSPGTAGSILSGQFANTNTALGNLGAGITGAGSAIGSSAGSLLSSLFGSGGSGISGSLASLFGSGSAQGALGGLTIDGLESSLGSSTEGGFESLLAGGSDSGVSDGLSALLGL
jgi:hypothetical protein